MSFCVLSVYLRCSAFFLVGYVPPRSLCPFAFVGAFYELQTHFIRYNCKRQVLRIVTVKNKQNKGKKLKFLLLRIFQKNQALFQIRFQKRYFEAAQDNSPKNL